MLGRAALRCGVGVGGAPLLFFDPTDRGVFRDFVRELDFDLAFSTRTSAVGDAIRRTTTTPLSQLAAGFDPLAPVWRLKQKQQRSVCSKSPVQHEQSCCS